MINSVNALEFLKPKLLTMDKYDSPITKLIPPSSLTQTRTYVTISGHQHNAIESLHEKQSPFLLKNELKQQERVRVQHLTNHAQLRNNKCWNNFRTLYNISASPDVSGREKFQICQTKDVNEIDVNVGNVTSTTIIPLNIQNKSAFNLDLNNKYHNSNSTGGNNNNCNNLKIDSLKPFETNNNLKFYCKQYNNNNYDLINKRSPTTLIPKSTESAATATNFRKRNEDQSNAYRHIESVHNYAKSKSFEGDDDNTSNGSRHSSYLDDDDDEEDDGDAEYDNDIDYNHLESNVDLFNNDSDADYEDIFSKRRCMRLQKLSNSSDGTRTAKTICDRGSVSEIRKPGYFVNILKDHKMQPTKVTKSNIRNSNDDEEVQTDVDVETVETQSSPTIPDFDSNFLMANNDITDDTNSPMKPDHHARRPMNAFLIFCKRHRAIVKERYKNLENRAITKILGDWWASLDVNDKKCFTNLAQENKDAFFSANPNFKWYKLPAPPLRTLATRPTNVCCQEYQEDNDASSLEMMSNNSRCNSNYFKLADETQMGDLSQLMRDKTRTTKECVDLQQALGETSQFMSAHITGNCEAVEENRLKRRFYNENSFSSNSSEDDVIELKKKSARSCKGKRYQELINSGQITTALKKSKQSTRPVGGGGGGACSENLEINIKPNFIIANNFNNNLVNNGCKNRSISETENMISYDLNGFDLEERIKELPALDLDDYLQRKRNTKKKKKFSSNGKKRGQRSNASNSSSNNTAGSTDINNMVVPTAKGVQITSLSNKQLQQYQQLAKQHQQQAAAAVGSQKRKARKESITRRDVAAIEQESASLLPLTINGCCYFQEAPAAVHYMKIENDIEAEAEAGTPQAIKYMKIENDIEAEVATPQAIKYIKNEKDVEAEAAIPHLLNVTSTSPVIPLKQESSSSESTEILNKTNINDIISNDNISSSTSDLLILAEVAANRTELKH